MLLHVRLYVRLYVCRPLTQCRLWKNHRTGSAFETTSLAAVLNWRRSKTGSCHVCMAVVTMRVGAGRDSFPRIPVTAETATVTGILTAVGAAVVALAGAILGGMAGMRYHRKVDRVGLGY